MKEEFEQLQMVFSLIYLSLIKIIVISDLCHLLYLVFSLYSLRSTSVLLQRKPLKDPYVRESWRTKVPSHSDPDASTYYLRYRRQLSVDS